MVDSVNKVILVGNLGADPEIRHTRRDGRPIANLSVATSETWRDKATGERREKTEWHRVVIFNEGHCRGSRVYLVEGLAADSGQDKYSTGVDPLDTAESAPGSALRSKGFSRPLTNPCPSAC